MSKIDDMVRDMESERPSLESDFYKLKEGSNRMRIMSDFHRVDVANEGKTYKGIWKATPEETKAWIEGGTKDAEGRSSRRIRTKGWAWAIIRDKENGDKVKIVQFPPIILNMIVALKISDDWGFIDFPMDYDIDVNAKDAGTLDVVYQVMPSKQTRITEDEEEAWNKKKPLESIVQRIYEKQHAGEPAYKDTYPKNEGGEVAF